MSRDILTEILTHKRERLAADKRAQPLSELQKRIADIPAAIPFGEKLRDGGFGVIAEIKAKSPSLGNMREDNVIEAPAAYESHPLVRAVSILTDEKYFGMSIARLGELRRVISKPILRKDFIFDQYQVIEARAYGADAVLLMANVLKADELRELWNVCQGIGIEALFECHNAEQIRTLPPDARICGVNSRKMDSTTLPVLGSLRYLASRLTRTDLSPQLAKKFKLISELPAGAIKVAESGVSESTITWVRDLGWDAALIGTSLLRHPAGISEALDRLDTKLKSTAPRPIGVQAVGETV
jgi:indole-3-glycerol phosphate synthase